MAGEARRDLADDRNRRVPRLQPAEHGSRGRRKPQRQEHVETRQVITAHDLPHQHYEHGRSQAGRQGPLIDGSALGQRQPEPHDDMLMARALFRQSQEVSHLGHGDEEPGPGHETDHDRCGNVPRQIAQAADRHEDLDPAGHHRQDKCRLNGIFVIGGRECQGAERHQGNGVGRTVDQCADDPKIAATAVTTIAE